MNTSNNNFAAYEIEVDKNINNKFFAIGKSSGNIWLSIKAVQLITIDNWHIYVFFLSRDIDGSLILEEVA